MIAIHLALVFNQKKQGFYSLKTSKVYGLSFEEKS